VPVNTAQGGELSGGRKPSHVLRRADIGLEIEVREARFQDLFL
jgi:hypothetical protein